MPHDRGPAPRAAYWFQRRIHAGVSAAAVGLVLAGIPALALGQSPEKPPAPVLAATVVAKEISGGQTFLGTVVPLKKSVIGSAVDGRVVTFPFKKGDRVSKGDVLAELLTKTIKIEIAGAKAELAARQHQLEELQNGTREEEKTEAKARLTAAQAAHDFAQAKYQRWKRLFEQSRTVAQEDLEQALNLATAAQFALAAAKASHDLAMAGPRPEQIAQAQARLEVQREEVNRLEDRLEKFTVRAPFDGFVSGEFTEVGAWLKSGDNVAEVVALDPVEIEVQVPENYIVQLDESAAARVMLPALPKTVVDALAGKVVRVVPQADVRARTFAVIVQLPNPDFRLKAGMLARVTLAAAGRTQARLVPKDALVLGQRDVKLYVVDAGDPNNPDVGVVREVVVEPGISLGAWVEAKCQPGDLRAGQQVVVEGNERLAPGAKVRIVAFKKY